MAEFAGRRVPVGDLSDIDVSAARQPVSKLHFWIEVESALTYSNF